MNLPVGSTLDCLLVTSNPVNGAATDLLTGATLVNPTITIRQGKDLISLQPGELVITKVPSTTGMYWVTLYLNPGTFRPGRTYSLIVNYTIGTTPIVREALLLRAMAQEPLPGYPALNYSGLWDAVVDGTKTFKDVLIWICSLGYGRAIYSRYDKKTNTKKKTMYRQDGTTELTTSVNGYNIDGGSPDVVSVDRQ